MGRLGKPSVVGTGPESSLETQKSGFAETCQSCFYRCLTLSFSTSLWRAERILPGAHGTGISWFLPGIISSIVITHPVLHLSLIHHFFMYFLSIQVVSS